MNLVTANSDLIWRASHGFFYISPMDFKPDFTPFGPLREFSVLKFVYLFIEICMNISTKI